MEMNPPYLPIGKRSRWRAHVHVCDARYGHPAPRLVSVTGLFAEFVCHHMRCCVRPCGAAVPMPNFRKERSVYPKLTTPSHHHTSTDSQVCLRCATLQHVGAMPILVATIFCLHLLFLHPLVIAEAFSVPMSRGEESASIPLRAGFIGEFPSDGEEQYR